MISKDGEGHAALKRLFEWLVTDGRMTLWHWETQ